MRSRALAADPLAARVAQLERQVEALLRARAPRDAADVTVLVEVARVLDGAAVTAGQLWARARVDGALREALRGADVATLRDLGYWLRRLRDVQAGGLRVVSDGRTGRGRRWAVCADGADISTPRRA